MKYNGLIVEWCQGTVSSGHLLPQVGIFYGFSETEMRKVSFLALQVEGACANGNMDAISRFLVELFF